MTPSQLQAPSQRPSEHCLQIIWQHQRLKRDQLKSIDNLPLKVLHPGFLNREAGPDFKQALLQFGDQPPQEGDVEIDLERSGWKQHGHLDNPDYRRVILHVVWDHPSRAPASPQSTGRLPTLWLPPCLDSPLEELRHWLDEDSTVRNFLPQEWRGQCTEPLRQLNRSALLDILHQAARVRLVGKARHLLARARQAGWEQALWEDLFRALGYKHNSWPMQRLAELKPQLHSSEAALLDFQALLLGLSGLLPSDPYPHGIQGDARRHLIRIWDRWWREQARWRDFQLPPQAWRMSGLRPANHPLRRLALAADWWSQPHWINLLEQWAFSPSPLRQKPNQLWRLLQSNPHADPFWNRHWNWTAHPLPKPHPLLGKARTTDLAMNALLPWLWIRAQEGGRLELQSRMETLYFSWPAAQDNATLKQARQRLLGSKANRLGPGAALQQGLLQIVGDHCGHSNSLCQNCQFPNLLSPS